MQSKITAIKEILEKREDEWGELLGYLPDCSGTIEAEHDKFRLETAKQIADLYKPPEEVPLTPFGLSLLCDEKEIKEAVYDKEWTKKAKVGWTKEVTPRDYKVAKAQLTKAKLYYEAEKENEIGKIRARIASGLNPPRNVQEEIDCPETHIYYLEGILQGCERMLAKYLGGK